MSEKYTYRGSTVYEHGVELSAIDIVDSLNEQQARIKELEEEKRELLKNIFLFEKGIEMYLQKEELMELYAYVDLEMKRWRFDNE